MVDEEEEEEGATLFNWPLLITGLCRPSPLLCISRPLAPGHICVGI